MGYERAAEAFCGFRQTEEKGMWLSGAVKGEEDMLYATEWCHGTQVECAMRILQEKVLRRGTQETGGYSGLWHGRFRKAVQYAYPSKLGKGRVPVCIGKLHWDRKGGGGSRYAFGSILGDWTRSSMSLWSGGRPISGSPIPES